MAARCVQGQLAACVLAKQRFRTAVADAAQSAQVKITVAELSTMPRACWLKATRYGLLGVLLRLPAAARLSSALTLRLGAGSAGVAGGRGAGMLLLVGIQQGHAVAFNMLDRLYK